MAVILEGVTANTTGDAVTLNNIGIDRVTTIYAWGTFDGASVALQVSPDGVEWFDITGGDTGTFTAKEARVIEVSAYAIRGVVTSAGASTSLNLTVM